MIIENLGQQGTNCQGCSWGYIYILGQRDVMSDLCREKGYHYAQNLDSAL